MNASIIDVPSARRSIRAAQRHLRAERAMIIECHTIGASTRRKDLRDKSARIEVHRIDRIVCGLNRILRELAP